MLLVQYFRGEVWIGTDNSRGWDLVFTRIVEYGGCPEIDELHDIIGRHDTIVEFEISVSESHFVEVVDTVDNLAENTVDLWSSHFSRHDHGE